MDIRAYDIQRGCVEDVVNLRFYRNKLQQVEISIDQDEQESTIDRDPKEVILLFYKYTNAQNRKVFTDENEQITYEGI